MLTTEFPLIEESPEDLLTLYDAFGCRDQDALAEAIERLQHTADVFPDQE